jgi:hypothetical protein
VKTESRHVELVLTASSCKFSLDVLDGFGADPKDYEMLDIAEDLTPEQVEQLALHLLEIASYEGGELASKFMKAVAFSPELVDYFRNTHPILIKGK